MGKTANVLMKSRGVVVVDQGLLEGVQGWFGGFQAFLSSSLCFLAFIHQIVTMPTLCWGLQFLLAPQK